MKKITRAILNKTGSFLRKMRKSIQKDTALSRLQKAAKRSSAVLIGFAYFSVSTLAFAAGEKHVHGEGELNIVLDGQVLQAELTSPAADIVGFEHKPENHDQEHAIENAEKLLKDASKIFAMPAGAECAVDSADVQSALIEEHDDHKGDDDHKDSDDHKDHAHDDHADHDDAKEEVHSDFRATYRWTCQNPSELTQIELLYFSAFSRSEHLIVQSVTSTGQKRVELDAKNNILSLK